MYLQYIVTYYIKVISLYLQTLWKVNSRFFFLNFVSFFSELIQTSTTYLCDFIFEQHKRRALFTSSIHVQPFHFWKASKHLYPIYITQFFCRSEAHNREKTRSWITNSIRSLVRSSSSTDM